MGESSIVKGERERWRLHRINEEDWRKLVYLVILALLREIQPLGFEGRCDLPILSSKYVITWDARVIGWNRCGL